MFNNEQYDEYLNLKEKIKELEEQVDYWKEEFDALYDNYQQVLYEKKVFKEQNDRLLEKAKRVEASDGICKMLMDENDEQKEKIKALEAGNAILKASLEATHGNYQQALSDKVALIERVKKTETLVDLYRQKATAANGMYHHEHFKNMEYEAQKEKIKELEALVNECNKLRIENNELKNRTIRFKELVTNNYRLQMSNNDLKENNKELKAKIKEYEHLNARIERAERVTITPRNDFFKDNESEEDKND